MTDLDSRLERAGARWREALDEDPSPDELFAQGLQRRRRILPMLAAAAMVGALTIGAAVLAAHRILPSTTDSGARACQDQLSPQPARFINGTAVIRLSFTGAGVCRLDIDGPLAELTTTGGDRVTGYDGSLVGHLVPYLEVRHGDMVTTEVSWSSPCQGGQDRGTDLVLHFDDATKPHTAGVQVDVPEPFAARCVPNQVRALAVRAVALVRASSTTAVHLGAKYVGGPAPGLGTALEPATFTLRGDGLPATARAAEGHEALLRVEPGRYQLSTTSGDALCPERAVTVPSTGPISVTVTCSVK